MVSFSKILSLRFFAPGFFVFVSLAFSSVLNGQSLLWKITPPNSSNASYIFGTYHLISERFLDSFPVVKSAITRCEKVAGEIVISKGDAFKILGKTMMKNHTLRDLVSEDDYELIRKTFEEKTGSSLSIYEKYKPMIIQSVLSGSMIKKTDWMTKPGEAGMDEYVQNIAKNQGKQVLGLETIEEQMNIVFEQISDRRQAEMLVEFVKSGYRSIEDLDDLDSCYFAEDLVCLQRLIWSAELGGREIETLLDKRNIRWIDSLGNWMSTGSTFVAVGAGHLPGKRGVLNLLRQKGYAITPVKVTPSGLDFKVFIFQDGKEIPFIDNTVLLQRKPFVLMIRGNGPGTMYYSISETPVNPAEISSFGKTENFIGHTGMHPVHQESKSAVTFNQAGSSSFEILSFRKRTEIISLKAAPTLHLTAVSKIPVDGRRFAIETLTIQFR